ncbi:MFS transporter [Nocardioides massiliensis]|uniref:MFS family permease n=1 Tax=Nocardioides massiliensis TaxID=1325935 RepID=A0ABT9NM05_9ACTN|nr:MFS transporter [Nocardioides massiliensis]MDP9821458.1 MFS family permease [Nocardioides massiliensis]
MSAAARAHNPMPVLAGAVLVVMAAQQAIVPVLAPLARDLELPEWSLGLLMTSAAVMFTLTSSPWGRAVDRVGHRTVLLSGLSLGLVGMTGFAIVCQLAVSGVISGELGMALMIGTRSLLFGVAMGAVPTAAMAWVAANTSTTQERVKGLAQIGAVQGLAQALGPASGFVLAFAGFLGPVWAAPAVIAFALVAVAVLLPKGPSRRARAAAAAEAEQAEAAAPSKPLRPWDPRLWPVMLGGFGSFLTLGLVVVCVGFVVQDRLGYEGADAVRMTGLVSTVVGLVMVTMQAFVVPRLGWPPWRMLRSGIPLVALGAAGLMVADTLVLVTACMAVLAVGMGTVGPGYVSAPTLLVGPAEQGRVAGLVQTVTGSTFMIGPLGGSALYGINDWLPFAVGTGICVAGAIFVWTRKGPGETATAPAPQPELAPDPS